MKWYGNITNRAMENSMYTDEIKVGTGVTHYLWSDRHAYEVVKVIDQKHLYIRKYDHKCVGGPYSNDWELISNSNNDVQYVTKRGKYWYFSDKERNRHQRVNLSFGVADYYYDYSF